jgi:hypothetical protein
MLRVICATTSFATRPNIAELNGNIITHVTLVPLPNNWCVVVPPIPPTVAHDVVMHKPAFKKQTMMVRKSVSTVIGLLASTYAALLFIQARLLAWSDDLPTGNDALHSALRRSDGLSAHTQRIQRHMPRIAYLIENDFDKKFWEQRKTFPIVYENTDNQGKPPGKQHQTPIDPPIDQSMCKPLAEWQYTPRPTCNSIHELSLSEGILHKQARALGNGGWRVAIEYKLPFDKIVFKTTLQRKRMDELTIARHFVDAAITDEMTHSPHAVRQYGYCSQAALNEFAPHTLKEYMKKLKDGKVHISSSERLDILTQVATGLVDLHYHPSNPDKVAAVYNDLKASNLVLDFVDNSPLIKLSDFNDVKLVKWNMTSDSECHFRRLTWAYEVRFQVMVFSG